MKTIVRLITILLLGNIVLAENDSVFNIQEITSFDEPWAISLLPDGRALITEMKGRLFIVSEDGEKSRPIGGIPDVDYGGQGGFGDVALHPEFETNHMIYLSYVESGSKNTRGAAVARGILKETEYGGYLSDLEVIWRQYPKMLGRGHYSHRLLFDDEGYLWISSGDRQKFTPSQDMQSNVGKIIRLNDDGSIPEGNPFVSYRDENALVDDEGVYAEIWSIGHRNPLGIAFDLNGQLWDIEMGPAGGDELNAVMRGANYGYPIVSNGNHYDGRKIPDHDTRPEFSAPAISWTPVISPGDLTLYDGKLFPEWRGNFLVAGLSSHSIIRIEVDGTKAKEVGRYFMGARIRGIAQDDEGALWVIEDEGSSSLGRLLKLTPKL